MGDPDSQRAIGQHDGRLIAVERDIAEIKDDLKKMFAELHEIKEQRAQVIGASKAALWFGRGFWIVCGGFIVKYLPALGSILPR